jgi:hypothetical protein
MAARHRIIAVGGEQHTHGRWWRHHDAAAAAAAVAVRGHRYPFDRHRRRATYVDHGR